jgi:hypothetical protein
MYRERREEYPRLVAGMTTGEKHLLFGFPETAQKLVETSRVWVNI